jgi:hypothetical protein
MTRKMFRALSAAALLAGLSVALSGAAHGATTTGTTPMVLNRTGDFVDTFAGAADTDPQYGLNVGLAARQTGTARASYTRVSGRWDTTQAPRPWYVQTNHPSYPNRLSFFLGPSAVMLGAPVAADDTGHYTISTTIDPVVGDTTGGDWGSLVLSRSHASTGYVTGPDVDLGLIVRSYGGLTLFSHGASVWSGSVAAAEDYQVSVTVSAGADRAVALSVNGHDFAVTGPAGALFPSRPYLYLGAYLSNSEVTTFGAGRAGEGLSVSQVDTSIVDSGQLFVDSFDGATGDTTTFGLNDSRQARQPGNVANSYTRTSGRSGSTATPAARSSQVNSASRPNRLSFTGGTSAVRADKPVVAGLDGRYAIHAVVDPVTGDTTGTDFASLGLAAAATSPGWPVGPEVALGLSLRSSGRFQVYQHGVATYAAEPAAPARDDGSFDVTLTVDAAGGRATLVIDGARFDLPITGALPGTAYLSLGQSTASTSVVSTVDDLRMSKLGGLTGYGYFDVDDPTDNVNHAGEVAGFTNDNQFLTGADTGYLDYCRPHSCGVLSQWQQFTTDAQKHMIPTPNSEQLVAALKATIGDNLDKVSTLYMVDEPYNEGNAITPVQLQAAADQLRRYFPRQQIMLTLSGPTAAQGVIPTGVDLVGFDWYCQPQALLATTLKAMAGNLPTPYQQLFLVPEAAPGLCDATTTDADIAKRQAMYKALADSDVRVTYLMNFGWWLGLNDLGSDDHPFVDLPETAARQQALGAAIIGTS